MDFFAVWRCVILNFVIFAYYFFYFIDHILGYNKKIRFRLFTKATEEDFQVFNEFPKFRAWFPCGPNRSRACELC